MAITLEARNYRGLRWAKWSPSGVCVLVGPNGSGKTTLLSLTEFWRVAYDRGLASAIDSQGGAWGLRHLLAHDDEYFGLHVTVDNLYWALQPSVRGPSVDPRPGERLLRDLPGQPADLVLEREPFSNGYRTNYHPGFTVWDDDRLALRALYDSGQALGLKPFVSAIQAFRFYRSYNGWHLRRNGSPHSSDRVLASRGENAFAVLRNWRDMRDLRPRYEYVLGGLRAAFPEAFADMDFEVAGQTISLRVYQPGLSEAVPLYYMPEGWLTGLLHLTAVAGAEPGSLVAIDEVENSLHPYAIRKLIEAFREWAYEHDLTVCLATHSPVVLDEFKEEPENVFVMEHGQEKLPVPLTELYDPDWLARFSLGRLFAHGDFAGQRKEAEAAGQGS